MDNDQKIVGCTVSVLYMLTVMPMWYVIMYQVLSATVQPQWVWGVFWAYVPISFILSSMTQALRD